MQVFCYACLFFSVCSEIEMVVVRKDFSTLPTFKVGMWKVKHRVFNSGNKDAYLEIKDQTCFKANDFLRQSAI